MRPAQNIQVTGCMIRRRDPLDGVPIDCRDILLRSARKFGVEPWRMRKTHGEKAVICARHEAAWFMRRDLGLTYDCIAMVLGYADHSAAHDAVAAHRRRIDSNNEWQHIGDVYGDAA